MKKVTIAWLITAASLVLLGALIFGGILLALHFDFSALCTTKYETNTHTVSEPFQSISLTTSVSDVTFVQSEDSTCSVVSTESAKTRHTVITENGILTVKRTDTRKWYEHISIFSKKEHITVYLPENEYASLLVKGSTGDVRLPEGLVFGNAEVLISTGSVTCSSDVTQLLKIKTSTGDIRITNASVGEMELTVSTGNVNVHAVNVTGELRVKVSTGDSELSDVRCGSLTSNGSTGELEISNVIATERFSIERSTGDVKLERCDAGEIYIKTDTGDVNGSLLSDKIFIPRSYTGHIHVPKTTTGGVCEVETDTGNIKFVIISH